MKEIYCFIVDTSDFSPKQVLEDICSLINAQNRLVEDVGQRV